MAKNKEEAVEGLESMNDSVVNEIKEGVGDEEIPIPTDGAIAREEQISIPEKRVNLEQPAVDITERIHEIAESIVNEKWEEFMSRVGDLAAWQERVNMNISAIKQEIVRMQDRYENLQKAVLGRVGEYDKGIVEIHTEMKALEKVFERIIDPLVTNVKELERITTKLKGK